MRAHAALASLPSGRNRDARLAILTARLLGPLQARWPALVAIYVFSNDYLGGTVRFCLSKCTSESRACRCLNVGPPLTGSILKVTAGESSAPTAAHGAIRLRSYSGRHRGVAQMPLNTLECTDDCFICAAGSANSIAGGVTCCSLLVPLCRPRTSVSFAVTASRRSAQCRQRLQAQSCAITIAAPACRRRWQRCHDARDRVGGETDSGEAQG